MVGFCFVLFAKSNKHLNFFASRADPFTNTQRKTNLNSGKTVTNKTTKAFLPHDSLVITRINFKSCVIVKLKT